MSNSVLLIVLTAFVFGLTGCVTKYIRVAKKPKTPFDKVKFSLPSQREPEELVEDFFHDYGQMDWKAMSTSILDESDLKLMRKSIQIDFQRFDEIIAMVTIGEPNYNDAKDRVRISVSFTMDKIQERTGSLYQVRGKGNFILADKEGWKVYGYVGDSFWGDASASKKGK